MRFVSKESGRRCRTLIFACALVPGLAYAGGGADNEVPTDRDGFTAYVAGRFREAFPDASVSVTEPLNISLKSSRNAQHQIVFLGEIRKGCLANRDACAAAVQALVKANELALGSQYVPKRENLWSVVLPGSIFETLKKNVPWLERPVARRLAGDAWLMCQADRAYPLMFLSHDELDALSLSEDAAIDLCEKNTVDAQPPFADHVLDLAPGDIGSISGPNEATLFLFHDGWAPVASRFAGPLLVALPDGDTILYADGGDTKTVNALAARAQKQSGIPSDSVPVTVYRWTPSGWDVVPVDQKALVAADAARIPLDESAFADYMVAAFARRLAPDKVETHGRLVLLAPGVPARSWTCRRRGGVASSTRPRAAGTRPFSSTAVRNACMCPRQPTSESCSIPSLRRLSGARSKRACGP